jgi:hypothetical protein
MVEVVAGVFIAVVHRSFTKLIHKFSQGVKHD